MKSGFYDEPFLCNKGHMDTIVCRNPIEGFPRASREQSATRVPASAFAQRSPRAKKLSSAQKLPSQKIIEIEKLTKTRPSAEKWSSLKINEVEGAISKTSSRNSRGIHIWKQSLWMSQMYHAKFVLNKCQKNKLSYFIHQICCLSLDELESNIQLKETKSTSPHQKFWEIQGLLENYTTCLTTGHGAHDCVLPVRITASHKREVCYLMWPECACVREWGRWKRATFVLRNLRTLPYETFRLGYSIIIQFAASEANTRQTSSFVLVFDKVWDALAHLQCCSAKWLSMRSKSPHKFTRYSGL